MQAKARSAGIPFLEMKAVGVPPRLESGGTRKGAEVRFLSSPPNLEELGIGRPTPLETERLNRRRGSTPLSSAIKIICGLVT